MSARSRRLGRAAILRALARLGELCAASQSRVEIAIYGGVVMMLAYNCREATKDVDAIFEPAEVVGPLIRQVAREQGLPEDWMNDGVKSFVAAQEEKTAFTQLQISNIVVTRPSPRYLLAMKCMAARLPTPFRGGDAADIKFLLTELRISSMKEVDSIIRDYYAPRLLENGKRWLVEQLLKEAKDER